MQHGLQAVMKVDMRHLHRLSQKPASAHLLAQDQVIPGDGGQFGRQIVYFAQGVKNACNGSLSCCWLVIFKAILQSMQAFQT